MSRPVSIDAALRRWAGALLPVCLALAAVPASAVTLVVDTTSDANLSACTAAAADCSLRGALNAANATPIPDTIEFAIPAADAGCASGVCRLTPASSYPAIPQRVTIDGYTQPGAIANTNAPADGGLNGVLKIVLDAANCASCTGLTFFSASDASVVRGLVFQRFLAAIVVEAGADVVAIEGNYLGTDAAGENAAGPSRNGIVLSGNSFIGEGPGGLVIGGTLPAQRNLISGHTEAGIAAKGYSIQVLGNLIGTNAAGSAAIPNANGVTMDGANGAPFSLFVGDGTPAGRNVISGNSANGVVTTPTQSSNNSDSRVRGNFIGTDVTGLLPVPNGVGVRLRLLALGAAPAMTVGGAGAGDGNLIAFNTGTGVGVGGTSRQTILGNAMRRNGRLGIGLGVGDDGSSLRIPNDPDDADTGSNLRQNFPQISAFSVVAGSLHLSYRVDAIDAHSTYPLRVEFFQADGDEGFAPLGVDDYTLAEAQTVKSIVLPLPPGTTLDADDVVVATATDVQGNTSGFSFDSLTLALADAPDPHPAGLPFTVTATATATSGPFKPNGVVRVSMNSVPPATCTLELVPTNLANVSQGTCDLTPVQAGNFIITATHDSSAGAFASASGSDATTTTPHVASAPGPEQLGFPSCRATALEGRELRLPIARPSGGVATVQVDLAHEGGSAGEGADYTAPAGQTLVWNPGDAAPKLIAIPITADATTEPAETFRLRLSNPQGASIQPHALIEVRILDGDAQGFRDGFELDCPT